MNKSKESPRSKPSYQALMGLVKVSGLLKKTADRFFQDFGVTQTQFNALMVLKYEFPSGCTQVELCKKLLVHPADVTGLMKRLKKLELIEKKRKENDERAWHITLSEIGLKLLNQIENPYYETVDSLMDIGGNTPAQSFIDALTSLEEKLIKQIGSTK